MANKRLSSLRSSEEPASSKKTKRKDPSDGVTALPVEAPDDGSLSPPPSYEEPETHTGEIEEEEECRFYGKPVPEEEARRRWPHRYQNKSKRKENDGSKNSTVDDLQDFIQATQHYTKAKEGRITYNLGDDAHVKAGDGEENYICKIVEMFRATDGLSYFRAQWYYRAKDTVIKSSSDLIDNKRVFYSEIKDDNPLDCLVRKLNIVRLRLDMKSSKREAATAECDYYCDMMYLLPYSSFMKLPLEDSCSTDNMGAGSETDSTISSDSDVAGARSHTKFDFKDVPQGEVNKKTKLTLLDLYAGCGGMSTGLCLGANTSGVSLVTKWAVDLNPYACESLRHNHPETQVRNESAEDFLSLLKEWKGLYDSFVENEDLQQPDSSIVEEDDGCDNANDGDEEDDGEVFEVDKILGICYGDPKENKKPGLYFKIRWKGYGPEEDTWEPLDGLGNCQDRIKEFVISGYRSKILPLPGDIDVVCGGPPCQGISGFNRFREAENPFKDEKNKQLLVYMDIIDYLKPRFVLMENVVDLLKFAGGFLGRYALGRLVGMNYQARLGMMAAGAYGLPQFRMRVFVWGALPTEKLPQYPLPTHDVVTRGVIPTEFELNTVAYGEGREVELEKALSLEDAISDLPPVENNEGRDEMKYDEEPKTEFQKFIRLQKDELLSNSASPSTDLEHILFDHRPLQLNDDDYQRVCQIPKRKGANFRHLKGVRVRDDKKVEWDPDVERVYLPSGKPLVPDYAMTFVGGTSSKPFGRLWWDETVPTVVTRAEPHNQVILHPLQDRVLTIRENARLQGFPDYYKLFGPIKERYIQVGNAVAVPVSRALGYALGLAVQGIWSEEPLVTLPRKFPYISESSSRELEEVI